MAVFVDDVSRIQSDGSFAENGLGGPEGQEKRGFDAGETSFWFQERISMNAHGSAVMTIWPLQVPADLEGSRLIPDGIQLSKRLSEAMNAIAHSGIRETFGTRDLTNAGRLQRPTKTTIAVRKSALDLRHIKSQVRCIQRGQWASQNAPVLISRGYIRTERDAVNQIHASPPAVAVGQIQRAPLNEDSDERLPFPALSAIALRPTKDLQPQILFDVFPIRVAEFEPVRHLANFPANQRCRKSVDYVVLLFTTLFELPIHECRLSPENADVD